MLDVFGDGFARRALLEAVMVGGLCGAVGVHVLLRRLPFFTMALGHATFPGVVLAALLGISLFAGAAAFGAVVVVVVALLGARDRVDDTSAVGVTLSGAFALGVLLLSAQAGFSRDLTAYLVGSIITVQTGDLVTTAVVGAAVLAVLAALHKELVLGAFDRGGLAALGYPVLALDVVLLLLIEATVVTSIPAVGHHPGRGPDRRPGGHGPPLDRASPDHHGPGRGHRRHQRRRRPGHLAPVAGRRRSHHRAGGGGDLRRVPHVEVGPSTHSGRLTPADMVRALCQCKVAKISSLMASIGPTALIGTRIPRRW